MRRLKRDQIAHEVQKVFEKSKGTYGSPRITEHLTGMGVQASGSTVSRVMATKGYIARPRRKFVHTTDSKHGHRIAENLLNRDFHADQVNTKWVSDITYIPTKQGWAYLTVIIDLADRMVVGWNLGDNLSCQHTAIAAMTIAMRRRIVNQPLLFHSDRGIQYCCWPFRNLIKCSRHITQSMSRKGNCWDNAVAESFFKTLKIEWTGKYKYQNIQQAKRSIFDYIERWYNTQKKHSAIKYLSPLQKHFLLLNRTAA